MVDVDVGNWLIDCLIDVRVKVSDQRFVVVDSMLFSTLVLVVKLG